MKKIFNILTILFLLMFTTEISFSESLPLQSQPSAYAQPNECIKLYEMPFEQLYYFALSSVNANKFKPIEMQSRSGYILFETANQEFLISVMKKDAKHSFIKLTPSNNIYRFSPNIPTKLFGFIDENKLQQVEDMKFN